MSDEPFPPFSKLLFFFIVLMGVIRVQGVPRAKCRICTSHNPPLLMQEEVFVSGLSLRPRSFYQNKTPGGQLFDRLFYLADGHTCLFGYASLRRPANLHFVSSHGEISVYRQQKRLTLQALNIKKSVVLAKIVSGCKRPAFWCQLHIVFYPCSKLTPGADAEGSVFNADFSFCLSS